CESTPPSQRGWRSSATYIGDVSPAEALLGPSYEVSSDPYATQRLLQWSEAAILGEPLAYLHAVWLDAVRLINPNAHSYGDLSPDQTIEFMVYGPKHNGTNPFVDYWQDLLYPKDPAPHHGSIGP